MIWDNFLAKDFNEDEFEAMLAENARVTAEFDEAVKRLKFEELFIAQRTVEGHKNSILLKTGTSNILDTVVCLPGHSLALPQFLSPVSFNVGF